MLLTYLLSPKLWILWEKKICPLTSCSTSECLQNKCHGSHSVRMPANRVNPPHISWSFQRLGPVYISFQHERVFTADDSNHGLVNNPGIVCGISMRSSIRPSFLTSRLFVSWAFLVYFTLTHPSRALICPSWPHKLNQLSGISDWTSFKSEDNIGNLN